MRILIRFSDKETEQRGLGKLIPRFSGKSWSSGEMAVPSAALGFLADEGIGFSVIGPAPYERLASLRNPGFKEKLKVRFDQLEIWITSHPVDVI